MESVNTYTEHLRITNAHRHQLKLHLEPWAEELVMSPNTTYEIVAEGPEGDYLGMEFAELSATIYGWPGSMLFVFHEQRLLLECRIPTPALPKSKSGI